MTQPRVLHPNVQVTEVTQRFQSAASTLNQGQLVQDEGFSLFDAVGSLEIGDPKMDSGCSVGEDDSDEDSNIGKHLTGDEALWIMDELVCREIAWHKGYPLSQTLLISVHIDRLLWPDPVRLSDATFTRHLKDEVESDMSREVLRPYCLALIKSCDFVLDMVKSRHYYEEEDFATQLFNRELLHKFDVKEILHLLKAARQWLTSTEIDKELKKKLDIRIEFRVLFLKLLVEHRSRKVPTYEALGQATTLLKQMEKELEISSHSGQPVTSAFNLKIQHRLASSVPPRPMVSIDRVESLRFFKQLFTDATTAYEILNVTYSGDLFTAIWTFMSQEPQPSVYIRSLVQSFLNIEEKVLGQYPEKQFIYDDLRSLVLPASTILDPKNDRVENPTDKRFQITKHLSTFVSTYKQSYLNIYRSLCLNRCRIRRTLCHAALEWDHLQLEAEDLDGKIQKLTKEKPLSHAAGEMPTSSYPLSSWAYTYKLQQLRLVTQLGFELSIYTSHELAKMYWYLSFLSATHMDHLERIIFFVTSNQERQSKSINYAKSKTELKTATDQLYRRFSVLKATEALAKALHRLFLLLQRHGHFPKPDSPYASENLRFELRMKPFLHLSLPEPLPYKESEKWSSLQSLSDLTLMEQANKACLTAKKAWEEVLKGHWHSHPVKSDTQTSDGGSNDAKPVIDREWNNDVRNCMKACIGTSIAVTQIKGILDKCPSSEAGNKLKALKVHIPEVGQRERYHCFWATPKISI